MGTEHCSSTGDFILIEDADLEYAPSDYPVLLHPLLEGKADVYGSRFLGARAAGNWEVAHTPHGR